MNVLGVYILNNMGLKFVHKFNNHSKTVVCAIQESIHKKQCEF